MLGWMDDEALARTLTAAGRRTGAARRQEYWVKGETSGHRPVGPGGPARLRRRHPAGQGRPGGRGLPHRRPHLLRRRPAARAVAEPRRTFGPVVLLRGCGAGALAVAGTQTWVRPEGTGVVRLRGAAASASRTAMPPVASRVRRWWCSPAWGVAPGHPWSVPPRSSASLGLLARGRGGRLGRRGARHRPRRGARGRRAARRDGGRGEHRRVVLGGAPSPSVVSLVAWLAADGLRARTGPRWAAGTTPGRPDDAAGRSLEGDGRGPRPDGLDSPRPSARTQRSPHVREPRQHPGRLDGRRRGPARLRRRRRRPDVRPGQHDRLLGRRRRSPSPPAWSSW